MIGLSGLITPSLDAMVHVAQELKREGFDTPLLIGGATTSKKHTAVRIAPEYPHSTVHVVDASKAVNVVSQLIRPDARREFEERNRQEQQAARDAFAARDRADLLAFDEASRRRLAIDWTHAELPQPEFTGVRVLSDFPLEELVPYIDWSPLFHVWELRGVYPRILDHPRHGKAARELYDDARRLLDRVVADGLLRASAVYGFFPANADGEDITIYDDEERASERTRFYTLRQQVAKRAGKPQLALSDFVAPRASGARDYLGAFAVTTGEGIDDTLREFERDDDDYNAIMLKALADRLAEAFAEALHQRVRREWGYGRDEGLTSADLIKERYRGIRPAPGYPACPDHCEKRTLFDLLEVESQTPIRLTESCAMLPAASVSGLYFSHPQAHYFTVGKLGRDQLEHYARRKGVSVEEAERWLAPNLDYVQSR